jgi:hypothetical protein
MYQVTAMVDHDDAEAATLKVLASLPKQFHGLWYTISELAGHLQDGGISVISRATVAKVVHADKVLFKRNRWKTTT